MIDEAEAAEWRRESEWMERERAKIAVADERHRLTSERVATALPYVECWRPSEHVPKGQPPRAGFWEVAAHEIAAWCTERWGGPTVMILHANQYCDDEPVWNLSGRWAMMGASMSFATSEQAFEFKMRWRQPTR